MDEFTGNLVIIGGAEDKETKCEILKFIIQKVKNKGGKLIIMTTATNFPEETKNIYTNTFEKLNFKDYDFISFKDRDDANNIEIANMIEDCGGIFFTGGDQLKITSLIGGTRLYDSLMNAYRNGTLIAGTSAGASCVCSTMIVSGKEEDSPKKCTIKMAPGLGFIDGVLIDQHFSQRGRIGRLLNAVAQNPESIGIGIDENTALVVEGESCFKVIGDGAVTVVDGKNISHTNVSELNPNEVLAITNIKLHVLPRGYRYDLKSRMPMRKNKEDRNENT